MVEAIRRYVALVAVMVVGCVTAPKVDNTPVAALDLNRYLGEWYEIARFDHSADYLWILSRTPSIGDVAKSALLGEAKRRGYDTSALIWVKQ